MIYRPSDEETPLLGNLSDLSFAFVVVTRLPSKKICAPEIASTHRENDALLVEFFPSREIRALPDSSVLRHREKRIKKRERKKDANWRKRVTGVNVEPATSVKSGNLPRQAPTSLLIFYPKQLPLENGYLHTARAGVGPPRWDVTRNYARRQVERRGRPDSEDEQGWRKL